jgi:hypothetical protein
MHLAYSKNRSSNLLLVIFFLLFTFQSADIIEYFTNLPIKISLVALMIVLCALLIAKRKRNTGVSSFTVLSIVFSISLSMPLLLAIATDTPVHITSYQSIIYIFLTCALVPALIVITENKTHEVNTSFLRVAKFIFYSNVMVFIIFLALFLVNRTMFDQVIYALFMSGSLINPYQSSGDSSLVRFSGVFNSAFMAATFFVWFIFITLYFDNKKFSRHIILLTLTILLLFTINRNAFLCLSVTLLYHALLKIPFFIFRLYATSIFIFLPVILTIFFNIIQSSFTAASSQNPFFKSSTLISRFDAWKQFTGDTDISVILHGALNFPGFNGMYYVDNGYLYLVMTSGILGVTTFSILVFKLLAFYFKNVHSKFSLLGLTFLVAYAWMMLLNNIISDPLLFILFIVIPYSFTKMDLRT